MTSKFDGWTLIYQGKQEEIAGMIGFYLWDRNDERTKKHLVNYIRILRYHGNNRPHVWRGVGIDPRAKACKCWIEDREAVNRFRNSIGLDPLR